MDEAERKCLNCKYFEGYMGLQITPRTRWSGRGWCKAKETKSCYVEVRWNDKPCEQYEPLDIPEHELIWLNSFGGDPERTPVLLGESVNGVRLYQSSKYVINDMRRIDLGAEYHIRTDGDWITTENREQAWKVFDKLAWERVCGACRRFDSCIETNDRTRLGCRKWKWARNCGVCAHASMQPLYDEAGAISDAHLHCDTGQHHPKYNDLNKPITCDSWEERKPTHKEEIPDG